jgi:hypothetical protein
MEQNVPPKIKNSNCLPQGCNSCRSDGRLFFLLPLPPPPLLSPPAAAADETYRACSAAPLADHFTRTSTPCNSFNLLKTEQQNDMAHSLGVEEADALVAVS